MSTRGAVIHTINGVDHVMYSRSDSYPGYLGAKLVQFVQSLVGESPVDKMVSVGTGEERINEFIEAFRAAKPTREADFAGSQELWSVICYSAVYEPAAFLPPTNLRVRPFVEEAWLADSLFCEWAWRLDWDTRELEVFVGFQEKGKVELDPNGRYTHLYDPKEKWQPVKSIAKISFYKDNMMKEMILRTNRE